MKKNSCRILFSFFIIFSMLWLLSVNTEAADYHDGNDAAALTNLIAAHPDATEAPAVVWNESGYLVELRWSGSQLTGELDVTAFKHLEYLDCSENGLTGLKVDGCNALKTLNCQANKLAGLNLTLPALENLRCGSNPFTTLDLRETPNLQLLFCAGHKLTSVELSGLKKLNYLDLDQEVWSDSRHSSICCSSPNPRATLTQLDVSSLTNLETLTVWGNRLKSLDVSNLKNLKALDCGWNNLSSLTLKGNTKLKTLRCYSNKLTSLSMKDLTQLQILLCNENKFTKLDVSKLENLITLGASDNKITSLNLKDLKKFKYLYVQKNELSSLSVPASIVFLHCSNNKLSKLDLSKTTKLKSLLCDYNGLTTLNISKAIGLQELSVAYNKLKKVDITKQSKLTYFNCAGNQISCLQWKGAKALTTVVAYKNKLAKVDAALVPKVGTILCDSKVTVKKSTSQKKLKICKVTNVVNKVTDGMAFSIKTGDGIVFENSRYEITQKKIGAAEVYSLAPSGVSYVAGLKKGTQSFDFKDLLSGENHKGFVVGKVKVAVK